VAFAVSIYNSMSERRREIAILRALGARRATIFSIVLLEAVTICLIGSAAGLAGGHLVVAASNGFLYKASGFVIPAFHIQAVEWYILAVAVVLGALSGLGPALGAYRTDVARNLAPTS
jgi:putative ABC transport system permease protein